MTTASLTRSERAAGIQQRQELMLQDDGSWKVRDTHGSGKWYTVIDGNCSCPDATYRAVTCKHSRAVLSEEQALRQFAADWDAQAEPALDEYRGPYGSDGWPQPRPTCPDCGAELETRSYYIGGRGYQYFEVCTADMAHHARQA